MPAPAALPAGERRRLTLGLALGVTTLAFEALAVGTAMPAVADDLNGISLYGWAFSAFMVTHLVGIAASGEQADRSGPRATFLGGLVLFGIGLLIAGVAPSMPVVVFGRAVQGFGGGALFSSVYVALGLAYDSSERSKVLAIFSSSWVIPSLVGPSIAGLAADTIGWRWVFLGLLPVPVIVAALAGPALGHIPRPAEPATGPRRRLRTSTLLAAGAVALLAGIGARRAFQVVPLVAVGAVLVVPALRKLMPPGTFRFQGALPSAVATRGLLACGFFAADVFIPLLLTAERGLSTTAAGAALTVAGVSWSAGSWTQARWGSRRAPRLTAGIGTSLVAVGTVVVGTVLAPAVPVWIAHVGWFIAGFGMGLALNTVSVVVLSEANEGEIGTATSSLQLADVFGVSIGAGVGGAIVAAAEASGRDVGPAIGITFALAVAIVAVSVRATRGLPAERLTEAATREASPEGVPLDPAPGTPPPPAPALGP